MAQSFSKTWCLFTAWAAVVMALTGCTAWRSPSVASGPPVGQAGWNQSAAPAVVRGQNAGGTVPNALTPGSQQYWRQPMPAAVPADDRLAQAPPPPPEMLPPPPGVAGPVGAGVAAPPNGAPAAGGAMFGPAFPPFQPPTVTDQLPPANTVPLDVYVDETRTGRFMFGVGVNSDAGVTGQIVVDERNFNLLRFPTSFDDIVNGRAFRGAGQGFRIEAIPGDQVQRYLVSFTEPYLFDTPISLNVSGFLFDRRYVDWDEQRLGGRTALGYRLTHDLSVSAGLRMEKVDIHDPRVVGISELDEVVGDNNLYSGRFTLAHDTRDVPFFPTEGHFIELSYEQVFGDFDYPRGDVDYRQYFLVRERPDGSGRHTLSFQFRVGFTGSQTPVFENYFAGGFSTLRGFDFRGASPINNGVVVGGEFRFLGSVEYLFPLTADDMVKGVFFCDYGTVEEEIAMSAENFRVAPGFGLRISIPALGPAPLAFDFAFVGDFEGLSARQVDEPDALLVSMQPSIVCTGLSEAKIEVDFVCGGELSPGTYRTVQSFGQDVALAKLFPRDADLL